MLRTIVIIIISIFASFNSHGQLCDGNLGINIFTDGDFGSGTANIPTIDPGIAPGYLYTTNPPPPDGSYCLTNDIEVWNQVWGWAEIGDNSNDPNGYMMVVNASYDAGLFYEQIIEGLCENTIYEFSADLRNLHSGKNLILPNVSFLIDDQVEYSSGDVPENNSWNTYGFTFTTEIGQSAVKLSLANNAPGGIGNDLAIDNITFRACGPEALILPDVIANICEDGNPLTLDATIIGDQYDDPQVQWQQSFDGGITWVDLIGENDLSYEFSNLAAGIYYYRYKLASALENLANDKCRIISNIKIVEVIPKFTAILDSLCEGLTFVVGSKDYQSSGIYVDTLNNRLGCDSIVTSDLTFVEDPQLELEFSIEDPVCSYSSDGSIILENVKNGSGPIVVEVDGFPHSNPYQITNLAAGIYEFFVSDSYGCSVTEFVTLDSPEPFTVDLGEDLEVDLGEPITIVSITSEAANSLEWSPESIFPCFPDCQEQTWFPSESGWIKIQATSGKDCSAKDSIYITVRKVRKLYIPNSFTPNDDKVNDYFEIFVSQPNVQSIDLFQIYDRWGNVVFEMSDIDPEDNSITWDGTYNSRQLNPGVYTYLVRTIFLDQEVITFTGTITMIR